MKLFRRYVPGLVLLSVATASLLVASPAGAAEKHPQVPWAALDEAQAASFRALCSSSLPGGLSGGWSPASADALRAEAKFNAFVRLIYPRFPEAVQDYLLSPHQADDYYRQYFGLYRNGRKVLLLNAFAWNQAPDRWRQQAPGKCQALGGSFQAIFDLEGDAFDPASFTLPPEPTL